ncbi:hypothetical protein DRO59_00630 [Candidatus Bathyarchaeota archaeon]|nr:MAG: hypothetical protein DRO59_00630 [Candidatus Bathyarchaeota archaeon]
MDVEEFALKLKEFNEPLTLKEIAERLKLPEYEVGGLLFRLVKLGLVKSFIRENEKGELEARYVVL